MYAIQAFDERPYRFVFISPATPALVHRVPRADATRFPTIEAAREVYRTLPRAGRFLIVPAEEDLK